MEERIPRSRHEAVRDERLIVRLPKLLGGYAFIVAGLSMRLLPPLYNFLRYALIKSVGDVLLNVVWALLFLFGVALLVSLWRRNPMFTGITVYADGVGMVIRAIERETFTPYVGMEMRFLKNDPQKGLELRSPAFVHPVRVTPYDITHYALLLENLRRCMEEDAQRRAAREAEDEEAGDA